MELPLGRVWECGNGGNGKCGSVGRVDGKDLGSESGGEEKSNWECSGYLEYLE